MLQIITIPIDNINLVPLPSTQRPLKRNSPKHEAGFTLIEVMVGVAIFAVLSAMIVSSIRSNGDRNAKLEAQRFIAVVNEVRDEAVISGKTFALQINEKGLSYGFSVLGRDTQASSVPDTLIRTRKLHRSVKLKWQVYESFNEEEGSEQVQADKLNPDVIITSLGEITPFEVRFGGDEADFLVALNEEGALKLDTKVSNFF